MADLVDLDVDSLFGDVAAGNDGVDDELLEEAGEDDVEGQEGPAAANSTQVGGAADEAEDVEMLERLNKLAKEGAAKRKGPKQPQLRLDANRLLGDRGLPCLLEAMQKAPVTGKPGRELDDLNSIMRVYELWLHRLHPRFAFDDAAERLERLGRQMPVRNALKRMRAGLPPNAQTGLCGGEAEDDEEADDEARIAAAPPSKKSVDNRSGDDSESAVAGVDDDRADSACDQPAAADSDSGESFDLQQQQQQQEPQSPTKTAKDDSSSNVEDADSDAEEELEAFDKPTSTQNPSQSQRGRRAQLVDSDDNEAEVDEAEKSTGSDGEVPTDQGKSRRRPAVIDSDED